MIEKRELLRISQETSLEPHVVEKDYVLGWVLAAINAHDDLSEHWVFKGGTCLKKCFFETYRFAENGRMIYKFFLVDLSDQLEQDEKKYIRYHGWLEAVEEEQSIVVKPAGSLVQMLDPGLKRFLLTRFNDDVMTPVCERHRVLIRVEL